MKPFSLLVKPASADCNLRCDYCFYLDRSRLYPGSRRHRMSEAVLERLIASYMATDQQQYVFGWQGGEPTLMGMDFFRRVTDLQKQYGSAGTVVANGLQTNATLIDDRMARHFEEYRFLLGVSLDGPPAMHDTYRRTGRSRPSHRRVMEGIRKLARRGVEFNILVLVSSANVAHPQEVYRYLTDRGFTWQQYIPCVEFDEEGKPLPFTITGEEWGRFISGVFDEWAENEAKSVHVRLFDALLRYMVTGERSMCRLARDCREYFVVEYNGDVYPCDFFVSDGLRLGNIMDNSWDELLESPLYESFGRGKLETAACCGECEWLEYCAGDCQKHRPAFQGRGAPGPSWLCAGWRSFFAHAMGRLSTIAGELRLAARPHDGMDCSSGKEQI